MNLESEIDKIIVKIIVGLAEVSTIIFIGVLSTIVSVIMFFFRKHIYFLIGVLGVNYFKERHKMIRDINADLIYCQGALHADSYGLFRTFNGRSYVEEISLYDTDRMHAVNTQKIKVRKVNSRPDNFFPNELDNKVYKAILEVSISNDWQLISFDGIKKTYPNSPLIIFLEANGIDCLMSFRIWDKDTKTFGLILFTWNHTPKIDDIFTRDVSKKLDSISIRFQNYIVSSIIEKVFNFRIIK